MHGTQAVQLLSEMVEVTRYSPGSHAKTRLGVQARAFLMLE
jgi:hypothetical protein